MKYALLLILAMGTAMAQAPPEYTYANAMKHANMAVAMHTQQIEHLEAKKVLTAEEKDELRQTRKDLAAAKQLLKRAERDYEAYMKKENRK